MEKHPLHLKNPELQTSAEVNKAVKREERKTREKVPNDPAERIEAYMARLADTFLNPDERVRKRNLEILRPKIHDALIVKRENFPESYFELQKRIARERGQAVEEIPQSVREQMMDTAIHDQEASLDAWMEYLTSDDAVYPPWFKYFVWRNVIKLSQFDKERGEFKKRGDSTVAPFPDIYREPLAQIADIYEKVKADNKTLKEPEIRDAFGKKFPALYAELIQKSLAAQMEGKEEIRGEWVKYEQGREGDAERLFQSLEGKGTGWCTAGQGTANLQIEQGDFYVYYSNDKEDNPVQPRLAIRMDGHYQIGEVRGVLPSQGVEPILQDVLDDKLHEFGQEADSYKKKSENMRHLTELERKLEKNELFTRADLVFLYEIGKRIDGFGYGPDPRIKELRARRDIDLDVPIILGCAPEQIARNPEQINKSTKAYVGKLGPGVFSKNLAIHNDIYISFPYERIRKESIGIGEKTKQELIEAMIPKKNQFRNRSVEAMMAGDEFNVSKNREEIAFVELSLSDLGFNRNSEPAPSTRQLFERANEYGLLLCPAELAPYYFLRHKGYPSSNYTHICMNPILDPAGDQCIFTIEPAGMEIAMISSLAKPDSQWDLADKFVFQLPTPKDNLSARGL